ncbi:butyrophilin subfamily 2 member A2-like isoform X2 [Amia ocellicauda]|uniref:butyrophilin subfamily 2 member A2-like isoform X2 n=1 Tax=Amia ocellicauda TaxID=2972642 RepID=UPI00346449D9
MRLHPGFTMESFTRELALLIVFMFCSSGGQKPERFQVVVPQIPLVASLGSNVVLPCYLTPEMSARTMEIRWFRDTFSNFIYQYADGMGTEGSGYINRVTLFYQELEKGNTSLLLKNVKISDQGTYKCHVSSHDWFEEPQLKLLVIHQGTKPMIEVLKHEKDSVKLSCSSEGWFPEPWMFWTDQSRKNITADTKLSQNQDTNGLYSISSHVHVTSSRNKEGMHCVVIQENQQLQSESWIKINDHFFESTHPVRLYISVILLPTVLALVCVIAAGLCITNEKQVCKNKLKAYDSLENKFEKVHKDNEDHKHLLDAVKCIPQSVDVILDPETAQDRLRVSDDGKTMTLGEMENQSDNGKRFKMQPYIVGSKGFTSGRQYWEVAVGEKTQWYVGVIKGSVNRNVKVIIQPEKGCWALSLKDRKFSAQTDRPTSLPLSLKPKKLGVYVDYERGQVSFYNVGTRSHIYTFTDTFTEEIYPFFGTTTTCTAPLTISTVEKDAATEQLDAQSESGNSPSNQGSDYSRASHGKLQFGKVFKFKSKNETHIKMKHKQQISLEINAAGLESSTALRLNTNNPVSYSSPESGALIET